MSKIRVENVSKIFGDSPEEAFPLLEEGYSKDEVLEKTGNTVGVYDVNFEVEEGEIFVLMGLSGSGKSTLLRCINRIVEPTRGNIYVDEENVMNLDRSDLRQYRQENFGMVFQNFALFPFRTVIENAEFGLEVQGIEKEVRREKAQKALDMVGLSGYEDQRPDQLSGGMQQRVGLARALAVDTDIMLMDEPFSALDPLIKKDMQDQLLELYEEIERTIVFITHDLDEALKLGDRIAIMKDGVIVQLGDHEEILNEAKNEYVADFVEDVNRSRVLNAEDIMARPADFLYENQGPRTALHKMNQEGLTSIFVVDRNKKYLGILEIDKVKEMLDEGKEDVTNNLTDRETAGLDEPVSELFSRVAGTSLPLPVVNSEGKLSGVIVKTHVIANLDSSTDI